MRSSENYHTEVFHSLQGVAQTAWDALVQVCAAPPFMRHAYLHAMHESGAACTKSGWTPCYLLTYFGQSLVAASPLYAKAHSYGEYVFDWAWANAYAEHGLAYYPKLLCAIPFTPVPAPKLLAVDASARKAHLSSLLSYAKKSDLSSLHLLYLQDEEAALCEQSGMLLRYGVQFHWQNAAPMYADFEAFLAALNQPKRKKIRQELRGVHDAGVRFVCKHAEEITPQDWSFFYHCYERTYYAHGNPPYLSEAFFQAVGAARPQMWLLILAQREGQNIAASLIALDPDSKRAYGRYWGQARGAPQISHLHFAACYYEPLRWCIQAGYEAFEGGAQGEHKMARGLMPVRTTSAHWLARAEFSDAIERFLARERQAIGAYEDELADRTPFKDNL